MSDSDSSLDSADLDDISTSSDSYDAPGAKRDVSNYGSFSNSGTDAATAERMSHLLELRHQLGMDSDVAFLREEKKRSKSLTRPRVSASTSMEEREDRIKAEKKVAKSMAEFSDQLKLERKLKKEKEVDGMRRIQNERAQITAEREKKEKAEEERRREEENAKKEAQKKKDEERRKKEREARRAEKKRKEEEEKRRKEEEARKAAKKKQEEEERRRLQEEEEEKRRRKAEEAQRAIDKEAERRRLAEEERIQWKKEMEENAKRSLAAAAAKGSSSDGEPTVNDDDGGGPYYTVEELTNKTVPDLDYTNREKYLKPSDYIKLFSVTRDEFNAFPEWKKTRLKRSNGLLS